MATVFCGADFHARKQTVSYLTSEDGEMHSLLQGEPGGVQRGGLCPPLVG